MAHDHQTKCVFCDCHLTPYYFTWVNMEAAEHPEWCPEVEGPHGPDRLPIDVGIGEFGAAHHCLLGDRFIIYTNRGYQIVYDPEGVIY